MTRSQGRGALTLLLALVLALGALWAIFPSSASAAKNDGYCDSNEVCVYKDTNLGTPRSDFLYYYENMGGCPDCHTYNYPSSCNNVYSARCLLNDSISSIDNWSDHRKVRFFTNAGYDGYQQTIAILGRANTVTYDNRYSSECWNDGGVTSDSSCNF